MPRGAFGPRLQAWAGLPSGAYRLSKRQVQRQVGEVLADPMTEIVQAEAVHVDETGWREVGRKAWLWVGVTARATAIGVHRSPGWDTLEALLGQDPGHNQVIISDRFPTYTRAPNRQLCWAHPRRDMQAMIDRASGGESVGRGLLEPSKWISIWWRRLGERSIARPTLRSYVSGLKGVVGLLLREGSACGCVSTAKVCRKILEVEKHLRTFAEVEGVSPDNNAAERALRHGVIWRKLSLGMASEAGSRFVERLLWVVESCRQGGTERGGLPHGVLDGEAERAADPVPADLSGWPQDYAYKARP